MKLSLLVSAGLAALTMGISSVSLAQACPNRGDLDALYCDANKDMVADTPTDKSKLKNPSTLVFTYTPVEDPAVYEEIFTPFTKHLAQCTGKRVVFYQVQSNAAEIEAMRSGRLHVGGFSTGPTAFAVNIAGAVPFAVKGTAEGFQGYNLIVIVKKDSPFKTMPDLKGKKVAHTSPSSNSGHMAPMALFPKEGLAPEKDYKILFEHATHIKKRVNSHAYRIYDVSILDILEKLTSKKIGLKIDIEGDEFRILDQVLLNSENINFIKNK